MRDKDPITQMWDRLFHTLLYAKGVKADPGIACKSLTAGNSSQFTGGTNKGDGRTSCETNGFLSGPGSTDPQRTPPLDRDDLAEGSVAVEMWHHVGNQIGK